MGGRAAETTWIVLGEDGRHVLLGRHAPPSEEEIARAEAALVAGGLAGWLALCVGDRWGRRAVTLTCERGLGQPCGSFADAVQAFERSRRERLSALG